MNGIQCTILEHDKSPIHILLNSPTHYAHADFWRLLYVVMCVGELVRMRIESDGECGWEILHEQLSEFYTSSSSQVFLNHFKPMRQSFHSSITSLSFGDEANSATFRPNMLRLGHNQRMHWISNEIDDKFSHSLRVAVFGA